MGLAGKGGSEHGARILIADFKDCWSTKERGGEGGSGLWDLGSHRTRFPSFIPKGLEKSLDPFQ